MSWFDDNAPEPLSSAEQTYANQTAAREAYYSRNPSEDPTKGFSANQTAGLNDIIDRNIAINLPDAPRAAATQGGDAQSIIRHWQETHSATEPLDGLVAELKRNGISADAFMYGSTASGNEITLNGQKYKVKTGDNAGWYDPSQGEGGDSGGNQNQSGGMTQAFTPPPAWGEKFAAPTLADLEGDTGYQEILKRGQQAIERSAASKGTVLNPGTLKDLADWTAGTASQEMDKLYARKVGEYGQRYQQYKDQYGFDASTFGLNYGVWNDDAARFERAQDRAFGQNLSLAQLGFNGAAGAGQAGSIYAGQGGANITGGGDAQAAGIVGGANAINSGISGGLSNGLSLYSLSRFGSPYVNRVPYTPGLIR